MGVRRWSREFPKSRATPVNQMVRQARELAVIPDDGEAIMKSLKIPLDRLFAGLAVVAFDEPACQPRSIEGSQSRTDQGGVKDAVHRPRIRSERRLVAFVRGVPNQRLIAAEAEQEAVGDLVYQQLDGIPPRLVDVD